MTTGHPLPKKQQLPDPELSIAQAAELKAVSPLTIRRWISQGRLRAYRYSPRVIRIKLADLDNMGEQVNPTTFEHVSGGGPR